MRHFRIIFSIFLIGILVSVFSTTNTKAVENNAIESGIYELENDVYHSSEIGRSMARTYLNNIMTLEARGGELFCTIGFSSSDYMENYKMIVDEQEVANEIVDKNEENKTVKIKFKINSLDSKINANMYVIPMGRDVSFDIIPKKDTLKLIEKIEEPKVESSDSKEKDVEEKDKEESMGKTSTITVGAIIIGLAAMVIIGSKVKNKYKQV
ncbi:NEAT domain-containing protein [Clostridium chauvoei]|uniref:NEAT domain-containing protein n=2 Tax=Clostridium chauvoei TaxID=46867 RepID=A0ABD4RIX8_9CLOT|nr:NEAT domain-containing protein [Clostridium chauvoei]ATD55906.1 hypothetical protein BTM20_11960 [Clostridium chauvoei]ATD56422.1 hypothetical protein BTM21_01060 [Clostridium chauvoei]MBX7281123.1 NEAT domain-containing protein [Clostridium chauvoei]MBX7283605.1 NEAT domain-containing protein [Clostridium chauvoei]MBX7286213.1 NEAT domain-containing protein [Clostridium chauvoei]